MNTSSFHLNQQKCFDKYLNRENIFITGAGGTGKSYLIRYIFNHAKDHNKKIRVTALTGCAAILLNCQATTLHSWAGIGIGNLPLQMILTNIRKKKRKMREWLDTDILIVDEVSMLSLKLFELLNEVGKNLRKSSMPFGGIQLLFSGDFYQLPPVGDKGDTCSQQFCFESTLWDWVFPRENQILLTKIYRQINDDVFANILQQIRTGRIKRNTIGILNNYINREKEPNILIQPTILYPTRYKVEKENAYHMSLLNGDIIKYEMQKHFQLSEKKTIYTYTQEEIEKEIEYLANNILCPPILHLKLGAQVMCIMNVVDAENKIIVCNGSQGIIQEFHEITKYPKVLFHNGVRMTMKPNIWQSEKIPNIGVSQIPLILSWAITIHKSQGITLDMAEMDIGSEIFECGQSYVALSRLKSLDGLYLKAFDYQKIKIFKKVQEYYDSLEEIDG